MHNMLNEVWEFIHIYCIIYFLISSLLFIITAILNFRCLKKMSTYRLILLYLALPYLWFRNLFKKYNK